MHNKNIRDKFMNGSRMLI